MRVEKFQPFLILILIPYFLFLIFISISAICSVQSTHVVASFRTEFLSATKRRNPNSSSKIFAHNNDAGSLARILSLECCCCGGVRKWRLYYYYQYVDLYNEIRYVIFEPWILTPTLSYSLFLIPLFPHFLFLISLGTIFELKADRKPRFFAKFLKIFWSYIFFSSLWLRHNPVYRGNM